MQALQCVRGGPCAPQWWQHRGNVSNGVIGLHVLGWGGSPTLLALEDASDYLAAMLLTSNGVTGVVSQSVPDWIPTRGHNKVAPKTDPEPAIMDLQGEATRRRLEESEEIVKNVEAAREMPEVVLDNSPVGEPQSNGAWKA